MQYIKTLVERSMKKNFEKDKNEVFFSMKSIELGLYIKEATIASLLGPFSFPRKKSQKSEKKSQARKKIQKREKKANL